MTVPPDGRRPGTAALLLVNGAPVFIILSFSPALVAIADSFGLDHTAIRLLMTSAMLACALGPLLTAVASALGGRKGAIFTGLALGALGGGLAVAAIVTQGFGLLLGGRALMTFGAAVAFPVSYAIITDVWDEAGGRRVLGTVVAALTALQGVVMALAGALTHWFGWPAVVYALLGLLALTALLAAGLPETAPAWSRGRGRVVAVAAAAGACLGDRVFLACVAIVGLGNGALYVYATEAPRIAIATLGLRADIAGLLLMVPYIGGVLALAALNRWDGRLSTRGTTLVGAGLILAGAGLMLGLFTADVGVVAGLFAGSFLLSAGVMPLTVGYIAKAEAVGAEPVVAAALVASLSLAMSVVLVHGSGAVIDGLGRAGYPVALVAIVGLVAAVVAVLRRDPRVDFL